MLELTAERKAPLAHLVAAWLTQRSSDRAVAAGQGAPAGQAAAGQGAAGQGAAAGSAAGSEGAAAGRGGASGAETPAGHPAGTASEPRVEVREVEVLRVGRPLLLDVLAEVDGRSAHAVLGVRPDHATPDVAAGPGVGGGPASGAVPGAAPGALPGGAPGIPPGAAPQPGAGGPPGFPHGPATGEPSAGDVGLGLIHDEQGLAVVIDALHDAELSRLALEAVTGQASAGESVTVVGDSDDGVVLDFGGRCTFTVFPWVRPGPNLAVEMLLALDEAGFNHLAAPVAVWRRGGRDLGVVQEQLAGSAGGWALALTSLRDLYGSGGRPEEAGGDFGPEAQALGTMTARMHLALARAFGQAEVDAAGWADHMEASVAAANPALLEGEGVAAAVAAIRSSGLRAPVLRTHGDFHLGRTARTDLGWVVADLTPGGRTPGADQPTLRSPLADVADMLWSVHHVSIVANAERDPTDREGTTALSQLWAARNRHTFLTAYLAAPGIADVVPTDRNLVRHLVTIFELARATGSSTPSS
jgi:maltokinase